MGGRGSTSNKGKSATGGNKENFSNEFWDSYSEDSDLYKRSERGIDVSEDLDDYGYSLPEILEFEQDAKKMGRFSRTQTVDTDTLYRGERYNSLAEAKQHYSIGKTITQKSMTSYSDDINLAKDYSNRGNAGKVVIINKNTNGKSVGLRANHTAYKNKTDPEILTPRGMTSKVVRTIVKNGTLYVYLSNNTKPK